MDRADWLLQQQRSAEDDYDPEAATYDEDDVEITPVHRRSLNDLLDRCPPSAAVLDAACGTGKYFGLILGSGRSVMGIDQSAGMLAAANRKYPTVPTEKRRLKDLDFEDAFDRVVCIDAMEYMSPEDWPVVIGRFRRALRPGGWLYLTVETKPGDRIDAEFARAQAQGSPVVWGESVGGGYYHYYPSLGRVADRLSDRGFRKVADGESVGDGYGYYHVLLATSNRSTQREP